MQPIDGRPADARARDAPLDASMACIDASTSTFMGHHYFANGNGSWMANEASCVAVGGHLVKIETMAENTFITTTFASGGYVWIGLSDPTNTDVYEWTDGTPLGVGYNAFQGGVPPVSSGNCVDTNGTWDPFACSYASHAGVCECE